jgi:hypothetical protein
MLARLRARRPSHTTIVAYLALFVAVPGGTAFAAVIAANKVNSASIIDGQVKTQDLANAAVGGVKIKDGAVAGGKVANNSLGGIDINEGTLGTVPSATNAANAGVATSAGNATNAGHATNADNATNATNATNAGNADTVDGRNATCPAGTVLFLGQCFEAAERSAAGYGVALTTCGNAGGYLPPTDQLLAFMALPADNQGANPEQGAELWTIGDGPDDARQWRVDEDTTSEAAFLGGANAPYRCVFPLVH